LHPTRTASPRDRTPSPSDLTNFQSTNCNSGQTERWPGAAASDAGNCKSESFQTIFLNSRPSLESQHALVASTSATRCRLYKISIEAPVAACEMPRAATRCRKTSLCGTIPSRCRSRPAWECSNARTGSRGANAGVMSVARRRQWRGSVATSLLSPSRVDSA